jgi:DNA polymerase III epsilon subunit-like protein
MDFIIMDLEWNNTYARKTKGFINEIIEIGAVKLDENLNFKDKFSCLVRPQIGKKLRGSVKELTMKKIRHKTKHKKFMLGLPAEVILHILIIAAAVYFSLS